MFSSLRDADQAILALNLLGGFNWRRSTKVGRTISQNVHYITEIIPNNIVSWSAKNDRRMQHSAAVGLLQQNPDWTCHPILTLVPGIQQIQDILQRIPPPEPIPVIERHHSHRRYFTDGACENPTQPLIRRRAWAVIQDLSEDNLMRDKLTAFVSPTSMASSHLTCIQTGLTHGATSSKGRIDCFNTGMPACSQYT